MEKLTSKKHSSVTFSVIRTGGQQLGVHKIEVDAPASFFMLLHREEMEVS